MHTEEAEQRTAWFVVRTKRHKERATQARLEQVGLEAYLPLLRQWPRPAVGSEIGPMFPSYLFVRAALPADFYRINRTAGVHGFVTFGGAPAPIDDAAIAFFRVREDPDGLIRCDPLPRGREVQITSGPLRGLIAVVEQRLSGRQRVRVLLDILQRQTPVELPERWVRQV
jgi:transcription antitermination factor NusG